jgi:hypothetical protein
MKISGYILWHAINKHERKKNYKYEKKTFKGPRILFGQFLLLVPSGSTQLYLHPNQVFVISHLAHVHMQGIQKHKDDKLGCMPTHTSNGVLSRIKDV